MRLFYFSYKQVKHDFSLLHAYAIIYGRVNITVNLDYLHAQNQGKLASGCLQRFSSIFKTTILYTSYEKKRIMQQYLQSISRWQGIAESLPFWVFESSAGPLYVFQKVNCFYQT